MFEVGQKVWDVIAGGGTVYRIYKGSTYPVLVKFADGGEGAYTTDGKEHENHEVPTLYLYPVEIVKKVTKPTIDWEYVHSTYNYLAADETGNVWLYSKEPTIDVDGYWNVELGAIALADTHASFSPGTCDWKDSLVARPKDV